MKQYIQHKSLKERLIIINDYSAGDFIIYDLDNYFS